jgi:hypothetical protein
MPSDPASDASSGPVAARKALPPAATPSGHAEQSAPTEGAAGAMASRDLLGDVTLTSGNLVRRQLDVLALQRLTGNAAVAGLFSGRQDVQRQQAPAASPAAGGTTSGDRTKIDKALQSKEPDPGLVKDIDDFGPANKDERIKLARILVYHYSMFFGPRDRSCLTRIFTSFGDDLKYVADKDPFLLEKCLKEWPGLMFDLKSVKTAGDDFRKAIGAQARKNLEDNITYLKAERKRLFGVEGP